MVRASSPASFSPLTALSRHTGRPFRTRVARRAPQTAAHASHCQRCVRPRKRPPRDHPVSPAQLSTAPERRRRVRRSPHAACTEGTDLQARVAVVRAGERPRWGDAGALARARVFRRGRDVRPAGCGRTPSGTRNADADAEAEDREIGGKMEKAWRGDRDRDHKGERTGG